MIEVCSHMELLQAILNYYGLPPDTLEITPNVQEWCKKNEIPESYPDRQAKCFCNNDKCLIVMKKEISSHLVKSAKDSMEFTAFKSEVMLLNSDIRYLAHLLLHEIACFILQTSEQEPRDRWAFDELPKHLA